jgi:hypothetical protein
MAMDLEYSEDERKTGRWRLSVLGTDLSGTEFGVGPTGE